MRRCRLDGLLDLNHDLSYVQNRIAIYLNELIAMGIAGVRLDAAKHIWPKDVAAIIGKTNALRNDVQRVLRGILSSLLQVFGSNKYLYVVNEVVEDGGQTSVQMTEYSGVGRVTNFLVRKSFLVQKASALL